MEFMLNFEVFSLMLFLTSFFRKKHYLSYLILLEILCLTTILFTLLLGLDIFFSLLMLCVGACEASVGLRTLIMSTRVSGLRLY